MAKPHIKLKHAKVEKPAEAPKVAVTADDVVVMYMDKIVAYWAGGLSFNKITKELNVPITAGQLRARIVHDKDLRDKLNAVHEARSFSIVDEATAAAERAIDQSSPLSTAGYTSGAKILLTVAEKTDPKNWAAPSKVELTGKNGGPVEVKADMTLSPADAYERMVKGA